MPDRALIIAIEHYGHVTGGFVEQGGTLGGVLPLIGSTKVCLFGSCEGGALAASGDRYETQAAIPGEVDVDDRAVGAADEGRDIVLSMLVVGLIFVGVAVLGDLYKRLSRKSHSSGH